jgi:hypothetical protein
MTDPIHPIVPGQTRPAPVTPVVPVGPREEDEREGRERGGEERRPRQRPAPASRPPGRLDVRA